MLAIYKRELKSYFQSMVGCVFVAFLLVFTGIYFVAYNLSAGYPYFSYSLAGSLIVFIVGIPLITMRSFSEERKNKTDQLLLTAPVSLWKVVLGKYLAMITVIGIPSVIFCIYPLIIKSQGTAYLGVDYISILVCCSLRFDNQRINTEDHSDWNPECDLLYLSADYQISGNSIPWSGLYFYSGIFPAWMRICSDRNVSVFVDRKSDYCIYQYIRHPFGLVFMERNPDTASEFGCQWTGGSPGHSYDRCFLYFPYDIEPDACRRTGSDRSCCGSYYLFCKIFFI